jgi:organic hydroperoxide reductase OsmC/OhrA
MIREHSFAIAVTWSGNRGTGTSGYKDYDRAHLVAAEGKESIAGSAAKVFHGDAVKWNPEEMLVAALSQCHMLSFLHVATSTGVVVQSYQDEASGILTTNAEGGGSMTSVTLRPRVEISAGTPAQVVALHHRARELCFIANSINFPLLHEPETIVLGLSQ